ncbi:MAG: nucleotide exchange factor GrpE [bacterium]|nr:nucleotide exchange factor GrpE [bacterium]
MSAKKEIKIQTDSDTSKKNAKRADAVEKDTLDQISEPEKVDKNQVDDPQEELAEKLKSKETEAQEYYDRLLRVSAEFENYKKRASREMEDFRKYSNQSLIKEMLTVVDNLELAINSANGHKGIGKGLVDGLEMTHREILKVFEKFNVKSISAKGQPFDPTFHEAVMQEESDDHPDNTVINELQKGYLIHDRLLRPSMVVVAKFREKNDSTKP